MSGYEFHSEAGLRTWRTYCPGDAEDRSTVASSDVMPSFREARPVALKTWLPAIVANRISQAPSALPSGRYTVRCLTARLISSCGSTGFDSAPRDSERFFKSSTAVCATNDCLCCLSTAQPARLATIKMLAAIASRVCWRRVRWAVWNCRKSR